MDIYGLDELVSGEEEEKELEEFLEELREAHISHCYILKLCNRAYAKGYKCGYWE